jgi:hypothetical protein
MKCEDATRGQYEQARSIVNWEAVLRCYRFLKYKGGYIAAVGKLRELLDEIGLSRCFLECGLQASGLVAGNFHHIEISDESRAKLRRHD